jgi:ATP-dependent RNA helicase DDX10/DBP4
MFERKNQNVLSAHYTRLVDHSADGTYDGADGDDFITLKRTDHDLSDVETPLTDLHRENLSKRKLKLGKAKRAIAKYGGLGRKYAYDDEGNPHELYEMADAEDLFKDGLESINQAGKKFAEGERGKMKETDAVDKEEAKERKREKKRKRKERGKGVSLRVHSAIEMMTIYMTNR